MNFLNPKGDNKTIYMQCDRTKEQKINVLPSYHYEQPIPMTLRTISNPYIITHCYFQVAEFHVQDMISYFLGATLKYAIEL